MRERKREIMRGEGEGMQRKRDTVNRISGKTGERSVCVCEHRENNIIDYQNIRHKSYRTEKKKQKTCVNS